MLFVVVRSITGLPETTPVAPDRLCRHLSIFVNFNLMGFAIQPKPILGRIDLASAFFKRIYLLQENIFFSKLLPPISAVCLLAWLRIM
jgi:hypothetical protein